LIVLQIKFLEDASIGYDSETPVRIPLSAAEYQFLLGSSESRYSPFKARLEDMKVLGKSTYKAELRYIR